METEPSKARNSRTKRRERAHQLNQEKQNLADEVLSEDDGEGSPRSSKEKNRSKYRRQRNNSSYSCEEDIIDGFAIMSFKTLDDLEKQYTTKSKGGNSRPRKGDSRRSSPSTDGERVKEKEGRTKTKKICRKHKSPSPATSPRSLLSVEVRTVREETAGVQVNISVPCLPVPPRCGSRDRFSDASTHSSSGQGYVCDIESGDEKASESGYDLFSAVSNCQSRLVNHVRPVVAVSPPPSILPTATSVCSGGALTATSVCSGGALTATSFCSGVPTVTVNPTISTSTLVATVTAVTTITPIPVNPQIPVVTYSAAVSSTPLCLPSTLPPSTSFPSCVLPSSVAQRNIPTAAATPIRRPTPGSPLPHKQLFSSSVTSQHNKPRPAPVNTGSSVAPKPATPISRTQHHREDHLHLHTSSRERERDKDIPSVHTSHTGHHSNTNYSSSLPFSKPVWPSGPSLYSPSPHAHLPPSQIHPIAPVFSHHPLHAPLPHAAPPHPHSHTVVGPSSHGMFAPPLPPGPSALSAGLPTAHSFSTADLLRGQDFLHQDLANRLLAQRGSDSGQLPPSQLLRSAAEAAVAAHSHPHLHSSQHMHQHGTFSGLGQPSSLVPTPPPHLFDKVPKSPFESGLYRPGIMPSYSPAFASLLPGPSGPLSSSLQGAFQPKVSAVTNLGPVPGRLHDAGLSHKSLISSSHMLLPAFRDRDKLSAATLPPALPVQPKKQGKWCAVHVRIAWEIYRHQQQKGLDGPSTSCKSVDKPIIGDPLRDPLRPPSHLVAGPSLPRPPDLPSVSPSLLVAGSSRLDSLPPHSMALFNAATAPLGLGSFSRPAPYPSSMLNLSPFGGLGSPLLRDLPAAGLSTSHDWNRLHRTPPSFPVWPKHDLERDKEKEREVERERERERERDREQREKERKEEENERSHRAEERSRYRESDLTQALRPRSRSPLRNGGIERSKTDLISGMDRRLDEKGSVLKVKEEQRGRDDDILTAERERAEREAKQRELHNYLGTFSSHSLPSQTTSHSLALGLIDRNRLLPPPPNPYLPALERLPGHAPSLWHPYDKAPDFNHRLDMEGDRERLALLSRLAAPFSLLEQERRIVQQQQQQELELRRNHYFSALDRDRFIAFEKMRFDSAAAASALSPFSRTLSPMFNHPLASSSKNISPATLPPPLVPTASATAPSAGPSRSHDNSPSSSKSKGYSAADSTSDLKDKRDSVTTDSDMHTVR